MNIFTHIILKTNFMFSRTQATELHCIAQNLVRCALCNSLPPLNSIINFDDNDSNCGNVLS